MQKSIKKALKSKILTMYRENEAQKEIEGEKAAALQEEQRLHQRGSIMAKASAVSAFHDFVKLKAA